VNAPADLHPTVQTLSSYGLGKLDDASAEAVIQHLESCPDCRRRVAEMPADSFPTFSQYCSRSTGLVRQQEVGRQYGQAMGVTRSGTLIETDEDVQRGLLIRDGIGCGVAFVSQYTQPSCVYPTL
jgi:anti-sigma factor RsiW